MKNKLAVSLILLSLTSGLIWSAERSGSQQSAPDDPAEAHPADQAPPPPPPTPPPAPNPTPTPTPEPTNPNPPVIVPDPPTYLYLSAREVQLEGTAGSISAPRFSFELIFYGVEQDWVVQVTTESGGNWLAVTPERGFDDRILSMSANPRNLAAGVYRGKVTVLSNGAANSPLSIDVTFRVRDPLPATIKLSSANIEFSAREGSSDPAPIPFRITQEGETELNWAITAVSLNGGEWLVAGPASGKGPGDVIVRARLGDLAAGIYAGRVTVKADGATNSPVNLPVVFNVTRQKVQISTDGVLHAATMRNGPIAPGQLITLTGSRLGPRTGVQGRLNESTQRFPTTLAGTRVTFDGTAAALLYVAVDQVNLQVPFDIAEKKTVRIRVESSGFDAEEVVLDVVPSAPGIFTTDGRRASALNEDGSPNSMENGAPTGSRMQLFLTGAGAVNPGLPSAAPAPSEAPFAVPAQPVTLSIDGYPARVLSAVLAPGLLGVLQVEVEVPPQMPPFPAAVVQLKVGEAEAPLAVVTVK